MDFDGVTQIKDTKNELLAEMSLLFAQQAAGFTIP